MGKHKVVFREEDHSYTVDGQPAISVTQLLKATGISKDFDKNNEFVMQKVALASEKGNYYDQLAQEAINDPFELNEWQERFLKVLAENGLDMQYAQPRFGTLKPFPIAGTGDFKGRNIKTDRKALVDLKATYEIYINQVTWQVALYSWLDDEENMDLIDRFVIHYDEKTDKFTVIELKKITIEIVRKLLECYQLDEKYSEESGITDIVDPKAFSQTFNKIKEYEKLLKAETEKLDAFYDEIKKHMEEGSIQKLTLENYSITYTPPGIRRDVDYGKAAEDLNKEKLKEVNEFLISQGKEAYELILTETMKEKMTDEQKEKYTKVVNVKSKLTVTPIKQEKKDKK